MAHALYGYDGDCKNIHGHTYHLHITLIGIPLSNAGNPKDGMVIDFGDLKKVVKEIVLNTFDHALVLSKYSTHYTLKETLSDQFEKVIFLEVQPTCENLLLHFQKLLQPYFTAPNKMVKIKLEETPTSFAEWLASDN